ncbi:MAG: glutamate racemase [Patescibacteria group bacterium]
MKIGIFDSGLGGLFVLRSIQRKLPQYDYVYFGDTKRVPYGNRTQTEIYRFTKQGVGYLFKHGCSLIILACNTASARALRRIQREYLPQHYPNRRVLGVIIPTVEATLAQEPNTVAVVATRSTVDSNAYVKEFFKRREHLNVVQQAAPLLVSLVENDKVADAKNLVPAYMRAIFRTKPNVLILGCTHYGILRSAFRKSLPAKTRLIVQNDILPQKLHEYLHHHPEIERRLSRKRTLAISLTSITPAVRKHAWQWFGKHVPLKLARLAK